MCVKRAALKLKRRFTDKWKLPGQRSSETKHNNNNIYVCR